MARHTYDLVVVGAGAAGLAAAQYGARAGLRTIAIDMSAGGQSLHIATLENYPGVFPAVTGAEFIATMRAQAESCGARIVADTVLGLDKMKDVFSVTTEQGTYLSDALIIATGAEHVPLTVPGEQELLGAGVSYCAVCDGSFFSGRDVAVVGGGDAALSEALYLASIVRSVTLIHRRDTFRARHDAVERLLAQKNITVRYDSRVTKIVGNERVQGVQITDAVTGAVSELPVDAVFILIGTRPVTALVSTLPCDAGGALITDERMATGIPGLFAAGDVRSKPFRQIVTAVSDGAVAALSAAAYCAARAAGSGVVL
ncbi:MAG: FAD-dependent oxidoreductase [Treponema sp.]|nr:FAD-dependent oxidoreductase [Treponema sp.]